MSADGETTNTVGFLTAEEFYAAMDDIRARGKPLGYHQPVKLTPMRDDYRRAGYFTRAYWVL